MTKPDELLSNFDAECLDLAIAEARRSFDQGNYPVGAILAVGNEVVGQGNNTGETSKNYSNHAETSLIIGNGEALLSSASEGRASTLYSTLEPCIMCLGTAVMNKVGRIVYVQTDPHAGACSIDKTSMGVRYREAWPEILHVPYSPEPKSLITTFLQRQIASGMRVAWSERFLTLINPVQ